MQLVVTLEIHVIISNASSLFKTKFTLTNSFQINNIRSGNINFNIIIINFSFTYEQDTVERNHVTINYCNSPQFSHQ